MRLIVLALCALPASACSSRSISEWDKPGALSPDGRAKARLIQIETRTQVLITMDKGRCGAGSVSTLAPNPSIGLTWRDATTLQVQVPAELAMEAAAVETGLDHQVQCYDHIVHVVVVRDSSA